MAKKKLSRMNHYLSFRLGGEVFALDVGNAREIVECSKVTQIPKTPPWIRGVINLRGKVVPVIDLKMRFDMGETEQTVHTCVIVVEAMVDGDLFIIGLLADAAKEVFELDVSSLDPPPKFGVKVNTRYIRGMAKRDGELLVVLDAERVFSLQDLEEVQGLADDEDGDEEEEEAADAKPAGRAEGAPTDVDAGWSVTPDGPEQGPTVMISHGE